MYSFIAYDFFYEDSAIHVLENTVIHKELADPSDPWIRVLSWGVYDSGEGFGARKLRKF